MFALLAEKGIKIAYVRYVSQQFTIAIFNNKMLWIDPGERLLCLKASRVDGIQNVGIKIVIADHCLAADKDISIPARQGQGQPIFCAGIAQPRPTGAEFKSFSYCS